MAKTVNVFKGEGNEQATSSNKYSKKNYKVDFSQKKAHPYVKPTVIRAGGEIEYKMPEAMYNEIVKQAKKENCGDFQTYLCKYVNEQFGLLGTCVRVIPY